MHSKAREVGVVFDASWQLPRSQGPSLDGGCGAGGRCLALAAPRGAVRRGAGRDDATRGAKPCTEFRLFWAPPHYGTQGFAPYAA